MPKLPSDVSTLVKKRIVIIGDGGVGKSAITLQFMQKIFVDNHDPTIESTYNKTFEVDSDWINLEIQDTAGQEEFASMRESYCRFADGFLIVFSITSCDSFKLVRQFCERALRIKDTDHFPILLVANKIDLDAERRVPLPDIEQLARDLKIDFIETSAKNPPVNIDETFAQIVRKVRSFPQSDTPKPKKRSRDRKCCIM